MKIKFRTPSPRGSEADSGIVCPTRSQRDRVPSDRGEEEQPRAEANGSDIFGSVAGISHLRARATIASGVAEDEKRTIFRRRATLDLVVETRFALHHHHQHWTKNLIFFRLALRAFEVWLYFHPHFYPTFRYSIQLGFLKVDLPQGLWEINTINYGINFQKVWLFVFIFICWNCKIKY